MKEEIASDLDRASERILLELADKESSGGFSLELLGSTNRLNTSELARSVGFKNSGSAKYRLEEKLVPAGLVERIPPETDVGGAPVHWELTRDGRRWVDDNREDLEVPQTPEEAVDVAREAMNVAEETQSAAGTANEKTQKVREEFDDLEGEVKATLSAACDARDRAKSHADKAERVVDELSREMGEMTADVAIDVAEKEVAPVIDDLEDLEETVTRKFSEASDERDQLSQAFAELKEDVTERSEVNSQKIADLEEENDELQGELEELREDFETLRDEFEESQKGYL